MTKKELVEAISSKTQDTLVSTTKTINALVDVITEELNKGNDVVISNLGTFKSTVRPEYTGRNPKTGEALTVPSTKIVSFRTSAPLKRAIN